MSEASRAHVGAVELVYTTLGERTAPPLVLIMGLGAQLHYWHEGLCRRLAEQDLFVIRFDNRDVGLSTHFSDSSHDEFSGEGPAYTLSDMATDAAGLIKALGFDSAHVVGISLGGMIAQLVAIEHPERVRSLVSIASTTGDPAVGQGRPEALEALFTPPCQATVEAIREHSLRVSRAIGSSAFELDEAWLQDRAELAFKRAHDPAGVMRQAAAVAAAGDRTESLRALRIPALVIHGDVDPLVDISGGRATAAAIPNAELVVIEGMGHDLPEAAWTRIVEAITRTVLRGEAARRVQRP